MFSLQGRTALLTGGAGGLGRAVAAALAEQGASVAIADLRPDVAEGLARDLAQQHPEQAFAGLGMDVTDEAGVISGVRRRFDGNRHGGHRRGGHRRSHCRSRSGESGRGRGPGRGRRRPS